MITTRKPDVLTEDSALSISSSAARRAKLNSQVDEFLARGGQVSEIDTGARTLEFSIEQPKRMDGSVPRFTKSRSRFPIDDEELREMVRVGKSTDEICKHYMELTGCKRPTVISRITAARAALRLRRHQKSVVLP
jgi:hypothetical protein